MEHTLQKNEVEDMPNGETYFSPPVTQDSKLNEEVIEPTRPTKIRNVRGSGWRLRV